MARTVVAESTGEEHDQVVSWYRERLAASARFPWEGSGWEPVRIGPTWRTDGGRWLLPDATLGWDVLGWCGTELQHARGRPWRFTLEQARFILWWYAVDSSGRWLFEDFILQRLKGWGKDPLGACLIYVELLGPCRFAGWEGGQPVAADNPEAWVQTAATSLEQTKNTMRLMPGLITPEAKSFYRVQVGKELIHALGDERLAQAVTSSPATLEGARAGFVLKNETQHWDASNNGHDMADVIERNSAKSPGGVARVGAITNAYEPGMDTVAERDRDAWETAEAGGSLTTGILYDSLEAPPEAPLSAEAAPSVVEAIRGDSVWLDPTRIVRSILDTRNPPSRSRRFWYNQIVAAEDAWLDPKQVDAAVERGGGDTEMRGEVALFFDGSKSDDDTGLVGVRMGDGHALTLGWWGKPAGPAGHGWSVPRHEVDQRVREVLDTGQVVAFYADPSHAKDDDDHGFWDDLIDGWHRDYGKKLAHWSVKTGDAKHSIMWDMTSPSRSEQFTHAAMRLVEEVDELSIDGHPMLVKHMKQARRRPNRWGVSLGKEHRESVKKIDLAVCLVGARMLRRVVLNQHQKKRTGKVYV